MENKTTFGVMCILFNHFGVPAFMQGRTKTGVTRLLLSIFTLGIMGVVNVIMGIMLGVKVLKMTDEEFNEQKYTLDSGIPKYKPEESQEA